MGRRVQVRISARAEIIRAYEWYEARDRDIAERFLQALANVQVRLVDHPELGPVWRKRRVGPAVRKLVLRRFPFVVFYLLEGEVIDIVAVAHARRRPGYWT